MCWNLDCQIWLGLIFLKVTVCCPICAYSHQTGHTPCTNETWAIAIWLHEIQLFLHICLTYHMFRRKWIKLPIQLLLINHDIPQIYFFEALGHWPLCPLLIKHKTIPNLPVFLMYDSLPIEVNFAKYAEEEGVGFQAQFLEKLYA